MHLYSLGPVTYNNDEISFMTGICFWRGRQIFLSSDQIYNRSEQIFKEAAEQILAKPWPVGLVGWVGRLLLASVVPPVLQPPCTLSSHFRVSCSSLYLYIYKYIENISSIAPLPSSVNKYGVGTLKRANLDNSYFPLSLKWPNSSGHFH